MKKFLFLLLFPIIAQAQTWTTVYGTIYDGLGRAYAKQPVLVVKTIKNGTPLVSSIPQTVLTDANGYVSWLSPRTAPGDTVVIYVYAQVPAYSKFGGAGVPLIIPNAETAELSTLVAPVTVPNSYPILVSGGFVSGAVLSDSLDANPRVPDVSGIISDSLDSNPRIPDVSGLISDSLDANPRVPNVAQSIMDSIQGNVFSGLQKIPWSKIDPTGIVIDTAGTTNRPEITNIEHMLGQFTSSTSDSLQQVAASVFVARNVAEGKAGADSVHAVLVALGNLIAGKGSADSIHTQLVTLYNLVAGKPSADSVHTALAAMFAKADTTALHAQKFALINDSLFAVSLRATSTKNDLTAHVGTADAHLPSQTGANGKFLQSNGTVSSWQTALTAETDPTAIPRTDSTRFVSRTSPQIPGLASADTNTVIGVDASGNLVLRKDDAGAGGSSIDSNRIVRTDIKAPLVSAINSRADSLNIGLGVNRSVTPTASITAFDAVEANVSINLEPKGGGAFYLGPKADGQTGGNARGAGAVDLQTGYGRGNYGASYRAYVASGNYSFLAGRQSRASGESSIAIGYSCEATGIESTALGGQGNAASGRSGAVIGGGYSTASGDYSFVGSGQGNVASGTNSATIGGRLAGSAWSGGVATANVDWALRNSVGIGKMQSVVFNLYDSTVNTATDTLKLSYQEPEPSAMGIAATNKSVWMNIDSGRAWTFSALVSARSDVGDAAMFKVEGGIQRVGAATSLVGTPAVTVIGATAGASTWTVAADANDIADALIILVTGGANQYIRWHATINISMTGW